MTDEEKEIKRIINIPISDKLSKVLTQLSILTSHEKDDEDKPTN